MNRYGNEYGYHNPILTELLFTRIAREVDVEWVDSSWHNDQVDSMEYHPSEGGKKYVQVFLPNSVVDDQDNEEFNTFTVVWVGIRVNKEEWEWGDVWANDTYIKNTQEILLQTTDINELVKFLNKTI